MMPLPPPPNTLTPLASGGLCASPPDCNTNRKHGDKCVAPTLDDRQYADMFKAPAL